MSNLSDLVKALRDFRELNPGGSCLECVEECDLTMEAADRIEKLHAENADKAERIAKLEAVLNTSWADILLMAGEMSAQETRTLKAVLAGLRARAALGGD